MGVKGWGHVIVDSQPMFGNFSVGREAQREGAGGLGPPRATFDPGDLSHRATLCAAPVLGERKGALLPQSKGLGMSCAAWMSNMGNKIAGVSGPNQVNVCLQKCSWIHSTFKSVSVSEIQ